MNSNITRFWLNNVIDTCSIWNILSSELLYRSSLVAGCCFALTNYVEYECLYKKRKSRNNHSLVLKLQRELSQRKFMSYGISIDDLQEIEILNNRKKLGKGELSSIVFAKKTRQAFLTDDRKARSLAKIVLGDDYVQTTPHLVGFCFYKRILLDGDFSTLLNEHKASLSGDWGDLCVFFKDAYEESLRIKLMERQA